MAKFRAEVDYQGYVRGCKTYEVEADSLEQAIDMYEYGELVENNVIRDDTDKTNIDAEPVNVKVGTIGVIDAIDEHLNKNQSQLYLRFVI